MEDVIESLIPANSWKIIKLQSEWMTLTNWRGNLDRNEHFRGFGPSCEMDVSVQVPLQGSYWTSALDLRPLETFGHPPLVPLKKKRCNIPPASERVLVRRHEASPCKVTPPSTRKTQTFCVKRLQGTVLRANCQFPGQNAPTETDHFLLFWRTSTLWPDGLDKFWKSYLATFLTQSPNTAMFGVKRLWRPTRAA